MHHARKARPKSPQLARNRPSSISRTSFTMGRKKPMCASTSRSRSMPGAISIWTPHAGQPASGVSRTIPRALAGRGADAAYDCHQGALAAGSHAHQGTRVRPDRPGAGIGPEDARRSAPELQRRHGGSHECEHQCRSHPGRRCGRTLLACLAESAG